MNNNINTKAVFRSKIIAVENERQFRIAIHCYATKIEILYPVSSVTGGAKNVSGETPDASFPTTLIFSSCVTQFWNSFFSRPPSSGHKYLGVNSNPPVIQTNYTSYPKRPLSLANLSELPFSSRVSSISYVYIAEGDANFDRTCTLCERCRRSRIGSGSRPPVYIPLGGMTSLL